MVSAQDILLSGSAIQLTRITDSSCAWSHSNGGAGDAGGKTGEFVARTDPTPAAESEPVIADNLSGVYSHSSNTLNSFPSSLPNYTLTHLHTLTRTMGSEKKVAENMLWGGRFTRKYTVN